MAELADALDLGSSEISRESSSLSIRITSNINVRVIIFFNLFEWVNFLILYIIFFNLKAILWN